MVRVRRTFEEVYVYIQPENWTNQLQRCPHCGEGAVYYGDDTSKGDRLENHAACSCSFCDAEWFEEWED